MADSRLEPWLERYLLPLHLGNACENYLQLMMDPREVFPMRFREILDDNQAYTQLLRAWEPIKKKEDQWAEELKSEAKPEEKPEGEGEKQKKVAAPQAPMKASTPTDRILMMLGKSGSRNALLAIRLKRAMGMGVPMGPGEPLQMAPSELFKHAVGVEAFCQDRRLSRPEMAFLGGLIFDWVLHLSSSRKETPKGASGILDAIWKQAFVCGQLVYHLAGNLKKFPLERYAFAAGIGMHIGKFLLWLVYPAAAKGADQISWADFSDIVTRRKLYLDPQLAFVQEKRKFPVTHAEISSLCASFSSYLRVVEPAIRYYQEPAMLKKVKPDQYQMAVLLNLASLLSPIDLQVKLNAENMPLRDEHRKRMSELGITVGNLIHAWQQVKEWQGG